MKRTIKVLNIGRLAYQKGLHVQNNIVDLHRTYKNENCDTLVLVEHHPVYTIGIRTKDYQLEDIEKLKATGAEFYQTNRGGLITFHGHGQLVAYPIINLKNFKTSIKWYVGAIEETIIHLCAKFHLSATTSPHTGVWIGDNKICAIGVHGSRYITTHGLALNCNTDLNWYKNIVPCGIKDKGVTTLTNELQRNVSINETIPMFLDSFGYVFDCDIIDVDENERNSVIGQIT